MQGMDRKMWRRQKLKDLNVDLKREGGPRVWYRPGCGIGNDHVCQSDGFGHTD